MNSRARLLLCILALPLTNYMVFGMLLNFSMPHFYHLQSKDTNSKSIIELLQALIK